MVARSKRTGGAERGIFAEAVARDEIGLVAQTNAAFLFEHAQHGDGVGHDRGLGICGEGQLVLGAFRHQLRQLLAERLVDFLENFTRMRARGGERTAHADGLAALSGEDERAHLPLLGEGARVSAVAQCGQACPLPNLNEPNHCATNRDHFARWPGQGCDKRLLDRSQRRERREQEE